MCDICGKSFTANKNLLDDKNAHNGIKGRLQGYDQISYQDAQKRNLMLAKSIQWLLEKIDVQC